MKIYSYNLPANTPYTLKVRGIYEDGTKTEWSKSFDFTTTSDNTPPPVPTKPTVTAIANGVFVEWIDPSYVTPSDFNRVDVYYSTDSSSYTKFGSIASIGNGAIFTAVNEYLGPYRFKFKAVDRSNNESAFSVASDPVTCLSMGIDTTPPDPPSNLSVTGHSDTSDPSGMFAYATATWTESPSSDTFGYYLVYGTNSSALDIYEFIGVGQSTKRINNLRSGQTYYFQINATDGSNASTYVPSTPIQVTMPGDSIAPSAPTGLVVVAGFNNIVAYWSRNSEIDVDLGRGTYQFQLSEVSNFSTIIKDSTVTGTVATFTGLTTGTTYYVRVRAIDSSGNIGNWSSSANATPGKLNAELSISSETIVGDLIAGNTIVGDKLIANTLDADRLKANTGIVGKLYVGAASGTYKITIDGIASTPAIYYGSGNYGQADTPFYFDANGRFSLKDQLKWNGNTLTVSGSLNVTQSSIFSENITVQNGGSILLEGGAIRATGTQGKVEFNQSGLTAYDSTNHEIFKLDTILGTMKATHGEIGGWTLTADTIQSSGGKSTLYSSGKIVLDTGSGGSFSWDPTVATPTLTITGTINASSGTIGNWYINNNRLENLSGTTYLSPTEVHGTTITGSSMTGSTIIGGTIKTANSGTRIEMNSEVNSASMYLWDHTLNNSGSITIYDSYGANALRIIAPWTDSMYMPMLSLSGNDGSLTYNINNDPIFLMDKTSINLYKDTAIYGSIYSTDSGGVTGQKRLRNTYINQGATPSGASMGDVWLVY